MLILIACLRLSVCLSPPPPPLSLCHLRIQQEDAHLQTRKQVLNRNQICQQLDLGLLACRTVINERLLLKTPSPW